MDLILGKMPFFKTLNEAVRDRCANS